MDINKIGLFLKELREEKGLTQEALGEIIGISSRTISRWETARSLPDVSVLIFLADYYDVSLNDIVSGQRNRMQMKETEKDALLKIIDIQEGMRKKIYGKLILLMIIGIVAGFAWMVTEKTSYVGISLNIMAVIPVVSLYILLKYLVNHHTSEAVLYLKKQKEIRATRIKGIRFFDGWICFNEKQMVFEPINIFKKTEKYIVPYIEITDISYYKILLFDSYLVFVKTKSGKRFIFTVKKEAYHILTNIYDFILEHSK